MKKLLALAALLLFTGFAHATLIPNDMVPWSAPFTISDYDYYHNPVVFCQYTFPAGHTYSSNPSDYVETVDCINNPIPNDLSPPAQTQGQTLKVSDPQDPRRLNEVQSAITWMYDNGLTSYNTVATYLPAQKVTREQASKFYGIFARDIIGKTENPNLPCTFSDINQATPDLVDDIILACRLGIFKGYNGKFDPKGNITVNASQTVFIRSIVGMLPETGTNYWDAYAAKGYEMGLFGHRTRDKDLEPRGSIAIYMFEYANPEYRNHQNQDGNITYQDF